MNADIILEIALIADYSTTVNLLKCYPKLNTEEFWKRKCTELYPDKTYLTSFSGQENFLLKERIFVITLDYEGDTKISNQLIEYHPMLQEYIDILEHVTNRSVTIIKIEVTKQFIVIKYDAYNGEFSILIQTNTKHECINIIEKDAKRAEYDHDYYTIDMNHFVTSNNPKGKSKYVKYDFTPASQYGYGF